MSPPTATETGPAEGVTLGDLVEVVRLALSDAPEASSNALAALCHGLRERDAPGALAALVRRLRLEPFEIQTLVVLLASHVDPEMPRLVAQSGVDTFSRAITVRLRVERLCATHADRIAARRAFASGAPLLKHRLISLGKVEIGAAETLLSRRVELSPSTLRYLLDEDELPERLARFARLESRHVDLINVVLPGDTLRQIVELVQHHAGYREAIGRWGFDKVLPYGKGLILLFSGPPGTGKTLFSQALASTLGRPVLSVNAADLPTEDGVDAALADLFAEATLRDAVVLLDECESLLGKADRRKGIAFRAVEDFEGILVLTTNRPEALDDGLERRIMVHVPFELPDPTLRRQIWEVHLPPDVPVAEDVDLATLSNLYDFTGGTIKNAILVAVNRAVAKSPSTPQLTQAMLDAGCRSQLRYSLEELTVRTTTHLRLSDIVLGEDADKKVREIIAACRNQTFVMNQWGFGKKLATGKGITVLFDGPPGTGKTFCAEIIAGEFDRPLYRVNLPEVVSKWVGETEKHIRAIFQQARISHAMLLFDEADSLFAQRSAETSSATDRYANMEVNLLLQEIERFPGVCILTTNFFGSLDKALVRRIQFRVPFEEPDADQRRRIFECLRPAEAPFAADVDFGRLGTRFEMSGGMIKNALLRAAYWAADAGTEITAAILDDACKDELQAAGRVTREGRFGPSPRAQRRGP